MHRNLLRLPYNSWNMRHKTCFPLRCDAWKELLIYWAFFLCIFFFIFQNKRCCCVLSLEKTAPTHHQIVYFHFVLSRFIDKCLNYEQIRQDSPNMYNNLNWWYSSSSSEDYQIRCQLLHLKDFLRFFFHWKCERMEEKIYMNKWRKSPIRNIK